MLDTIAKLPPFAIVSIAVLLLAFPVRGEQQAAEKKLPPSPPKKHTPIRLVKLKNFNSQDAFRDSLRYALCVASNDNLGFFEREYPLNAKFVDRAELMEIQVLENHPALVCKLWMRPVKAPLLFILPGFGAHYQASGPNSMAQLFFNAGYSVALFSSAVNWEFYQAASRSKAPGLPATDAMDVRKAITVAIAAIKSSYPGKVSSLYLAGYSLGALHVLFVVSQEKKVKNKIGIAGYLAVHPPVNTFKAMKKLDELMSPWRTWPKNKSLLHLQKGAAAYLALLKHGLPKNGEIQLSAKEAEITIAMAYRIALRDLMLAIKASGNDMGLIKTPYGFTKNKLYKELNAISFEEYTDKFAKKAAELRLKTKLSVATLGKISNLGFLEKELASARNVSVITAQDDFLLSKADLQWLANTFKDRCVVFDHGGHMGELYTPEARKAMIDALAKTSDLRPTDKK